MAAEHSVAQGNVTGGADIDALIAEACGVGALPSCTSIIARLAQLRERLEQQRLQIAVLGQFKRGKSTFLNALIGAPVLPMAVTPLTAIPTFIQSGENFGLQTVKVSGETEQLAVLNIEALQSLLKARVTEEGNPDNRLGLERVEVTLPPSFRVGGAVLIDTPGVGSTYRHNTETARAILSECDVALFVVSPDPPITEAELDFLALVHSTAARIVLVLNKIDILDEDERVEAIAFLRRVASRTAGLRDAPLFPLSARRALRTKMAGVHEELGASGFDVVERYLETFVAEEKSATLARAVAGKAAALVGELRFDAEGALAALRMPVERLSEKLARFEEVAPQFAAERQSSSDLIAGDRKRILSELDTDAEELRAATERDIATRIGEELAAGSSESEIGEGIGELLPSLFEREFAACERRVRERFERAMGKHQASAERLIAAVRQTAAELLDIPYRAPLPAEAFELKKLPYWVSKTRESLRILPPGAADGLLPAAVRRRRAQRRLADSVGEIIRRNVENLRWSLRQNLEDGFRSFEATLDEKLKLSFDATRNALRRGLSLRSDTEAEMKANVEQALAAASRLSEIEVSLQQSAIE